MRFYDIALYTFIFNLVLGIVPTVISLDAGMTSIAGFGRPEIESGINSTTSAVSNAYTPILSEVNWIVENVRLAAQGIFIIISAFAGATIAFPVIINNLMCGVPGACTLGVHPFAALMGTMILFVYFIGIVQFMRGQSFREAS